jgi:tetratricopeptide (TPR) repeat protein
MEVGLLLLGVQPLSHHQDPYVGFASYLPLFVEENGQQGERLRVTAQSKLPFFNRQQFALEKPTGIFRIFCLGGSTTYGRPYDDTTSFCGWLREFLPQADPSRQWEVINAGGISYASYRIALLMEELIGYDPDLFIIYSGHNEFLEKRTYSQTVAVPGFFRSLGALVSRTRIAAALKQAVEGATRISDNNRTEGENLPAEVETILEQDIVVGPEAYHRDELFQQNVLEHYRYNLNRMIDMARSIGSNVLLVNPASNLRHCSPFKSEHTKGLPPSQRQRWRALFDRAKLAHETGSPQTSLAAIKEAAAIDDGYAHLDFLRGQVLWQLERHGEAKAAFSRARDQDICPLRILSPMQQTLKSVATEQQVPLFDFVKLVEQHSENHVPGENFFLDHVHPTIEGHRLLALALLEAMQRQKIVKTADNWNKAAIGKITRKLENRLDDQAHSMALHNLAAVLSWAGKFEEAHKLALRAIERFPDNAQAHYQAGINGSTLGQHDRAIDHYQRALQLMPDHVEAHGQLGKELLGKGRLEEAIHYSRRALELRPGYTEAHTYLGNALLAQGNSKEAIRHYQRSAQLKPADRAVTSYNLGNAYQVQGETDEATRYYRLALSLQPDHAPAHTNLGNVLLGQGHVQEAARHFRQALESEPDQAEAHIGLGNALATDEQIEQAIRHYRRALQTRPNDAMAHFNLGNVLYSQGQLQKAIVHFRKAVQSRPGYAEAHNNLGLALSVSGQLDNALRHFEQAFEIDPNWAAPLNGMASILAEHPNPRRRNPARAIQFAKRASELTQHRSAPILNTLASAQAAAGQFDRAVTTAQKALALASANRTDKLAEEIRQRLEFYRRAGR